MAPKAFGVIGIKSHCFADPFDALFRASQPDQDFALLNDNQIIVGIEAKRAFLMVDRLSVVRGPPL